MNLISYLPLIEAPSYCPSLFFCLLQIKYYPCNRVRYAMVSVFNWQFCLRFALESDTGFPKLALSHRYYSHSFQESRCCDGLHYVVSYLSVTASLHRV